MDSQPRHLILVSRPMNTMTFADGAWEGRSRSEEEVMQGHRRRRATLRSPATPISPKGGGGTASISLSLLLHDVTDIASSLLRELYAVALATNIMVFMRRDTKETRETHESAWENLPSRFSGPFSGGEDRQAYPHHTSREAKRTHQWSICPGFPARRR